MAEQECSLLGGPFALVVQGGLAAGALCTLAYKRAVERPRRSLLVWSFDASKQAWAGTLQHGVNLLLGVWLARGGGRASECAWYLLNFTISIGCGIFLLWAAMRAYRQLVERFGLTMLRSGEYGNPPSWKPWLAQLVVWGAISAGEKLLTALLLILPLHGSLDKFAWWVERPLVPYPNTELLLVMVVAPVLLNPSGGVVDNIVMRKRPRGRMDEGSADEEDMPLLTEESTAVTR
ncbi:MAG: hypothetical protein SGPRY_001843, partial [Prymnesium sp.]